MACAEEADKYNFHSLDIFLKRVKPYNPNGRNQTEKESNEIAETILKMLKDQNVVYHTFNGDLDGYDKIFEIIMKNINATADKISNT